MVKKLLLMSAIWLLAAGVSHGQATPESPDGGGRGKSAREIEKYVRELEKDSLMRTTSWSVLIKDLETGEVVASHEPQLSLAGASITKLLTTGAALASLGGDFRYETKLGYDGQITDSTLYGTLYVIGGGDPTLGSDYREFLPRAMYLPAGSCASTFPSSTDRAPRSHTCRMPPAVTKPS